jgi:hypothetical protein
MTTRNFRVNNGLSVGDIVISASTNTITGLSTEAPEADGDVVVKGYLDTRISALSANSITQGNSNVTVTDAGTGTIKTTVDGTDMIVATAAGVTISNLTVSGTQTIVNSTSLEVEDNIIGLNRNASGNAFMPRFTGLHAHRGETSSATEQDLYWVWDEAFNDDRSTIYGESGGGAWTALRSTHNTATQTPNDDFQLVDIRCRVINATATSAQYADIAERFAADAVMTPGAVVMFGGAQEITETAEELSEKVFGVVSTQPAYMMNSGAGNNDSHPFVAMTGRTPVRVTGTVNKGDRLVSSSVKGTARAARTGESINPFHVIGRALESKSDAGIGLVNCFVQAKN